MDEPRMKKRRGPYGKIKEKSHDEDNFMVDNETDDVESVSIETFVNIGGAEPESERKETPTKQLIAESSSTDNGVRFQYILCTQRVTIHRRKSYIRIVPKEYYFWEML